MQPYPITRRTDYKYVRLIDANEKYHNSVFIGDARTEAREYGLDLVCFSNPQGRDLALCKIIDYGKWKYQQDKSKKKESVQNRHVVKEVRFSPVIDEHDISYKIKQVEEFLEEGDEVILSMRFKGVQKRNFEIGEKLMLHIIGLCKDKSEVLSNKRTGNTITVKIKKKTKP